MFVFRPLAGCVCNIFTVNKVLVLTFLEMMLLGTSRDAREGTETHVSIKQLKCRRKSCINWVKLSLCFGLTCSSSLDYFCDWICRPRQGRPEVDGLPGGCQVHGLSLPQQHGAHL